MSTVDEHGPGAVPRGPIERLGIPRPLLWGFVGVLIFMIGDGVETGYISTFIADQPGFDRGQAESAITIYSLAVAIGSWFSGALSAIWGPRRVMALGAGIWVVFEVVFLAIGLPSASYGLLVLCYGIRGFGYPMFAYAFLVWISAASPRRLLGSAVGWFWFAFTGGLPTLGSLVASALIPAVGEWVTLWLSLVLVLLGALIGTVAVRDRHGSQPLVAEDADKSKEFLRGVSILWRHPKIAIGGVVRMINTAPEFGFFVFLPFVFVQTLGFSTAEWLLLNTLIYASNIVANLVFGFVGDRFGWRRTVTYFGGLGCTITTLVLYYVPLAAGQNFGIAAICGLLYGFTLAGYVPLSALLPSMASTEDKGAALAVLNLGAGLATFLGTALVAALRPAIGVGGVVWVFAVLYLASAVMASRLKHHSDPGEPALATDTAGSPAPAR